MAASERHSNRTLEMLGGTVGAGAGVYCPRAQLAIRALSCYKITPGYSVAHGCYSAKVPGKDTTTRRREGDPPCTTTIPSETTPHRSDEQHRR